MRYFAMCTGEDCPIRSQCARFNATPAEDEMWIHAPYNHAKGECWYLIPIDKPKKYGDEVDDLFPAP